MRAPSSNRRGFFCGEGMGVTDLIRRLSDAHSQGGKAGDAAGCALKKTRILNLDKRITCDNVIKQNKIVKLMRFKRCDKG